ncbi:hypothetical protein LQW54_007061 [Pestalotiopsis sp. IQ-011]
MASTSPSSEAPTDQRPVEHGRPIKVVCIGAGVSGILTGIRLPQRVDNLDLVIYEKNQDVGGTWYENKYPGVACDIPALAFQFTFENNPRWSRFYHPGPEILAYLGRVADKYGAREYMRLGHEFRGARWAEAAGKWEVQVLRLSDHQMIYDTADVLIVDAETSIRCTGKSLAVIGNGSTGRQILPALQTQAKHIDTYIRSKAWISPRGPFKRQVEEHGGDENFAFTDSEKQKFAEDPQFLTAYRKDIEDILYRDFLQTFSNLPERQDSDKLAMQLVEQKLALQPGLFEALKPEDPSARRRLGVSPGYLEALAQDNVHVVTAGIRRIRAEGVVDNGGTIRPVDAIVCATGFDTSSTTSETPVYGRGGIPLDQVRSEAYLSLMPCHMPNLFLFPGPGADAPPMTALAEARCEYMVKCLQKLQRERLRSMVPTAAARDDFVRHAGAAWPGSLADALSVYESPRWEKFEYEALPGGEGRFD